MKLIDLTQAYQEYFVKRGDRLAYQASYPALFSHYDEFWGVPGRELVRLGTPELSVRRQNILDCLSDLGDRFSAAGLDLTGVELILMVGQGTSNGHGMLIPGACAAWLAVETYTTPLLARVFVAHELVHACHYLHNREMYFSNSDQLRDPMRQLLTEGVATYLSKEILQIDWGTALWADYLELAKRRAWMQLCHDELDGLVRHFLEDLNSGLRTRMFLASDPTDINRYRSGYYLGLAVIETIVADIQLEPMQLLAYPRDQLERHARRLLEGPSELIKNL